MTKKVADVIDLETGPPNGDTNPEGAADALGELQFVDEAKPGAEPQPRPAIDIKKKRQTKAELEADNARLHAELDAQKQQAAANAPGLIDSMKPALSLTFRAASGIMATWKGPHWRFEDAECTLLADAWAPCVGPMLAAHPEAIVWAAALGVTYSVVAPRVQKERELQEKKKLEESTGEVVPNAS